ncbi:MAG TPA: hypothetical protein VH087_02245 [Thermoanaerobaculia bacterium]|nr:hypothetical protein [Thermoanaerobaculia bacterium]
MTASRPVVLLALALLVVLVPAALLPISSYDFFWHLATGRWITEHHALPLSDPFAIASDRVPWINGEWLFQVALYAIRSTVWIDRIRALCVGLLFAFGFVVASKKSGWPVALALTGFAFVGAYDHLDARPSTAAAALLVIGIALLCGAADSAADNHPNASGSAAPPRSRADVAYIVLTIVWINVHPSALLAPLIALLFRRLHWLPVASALALLVNPFGWNAVLAPLKLTVFARGGTFVNAEWLPSPAAIFPLLYVTVLFGVIAFLVSKQDLWRFATFALLAYLAIAHVRNQGLYFAAMPLLVAPLVPRRWSHRAVGLLAILPIVWAYANGPHIAGIAAHRFPVVATEVIRAENLQGNIYNPDQFGGYLIWSFYPQRRALTDGRNELYHAFIDEYAKARLDSRAWRALLAKYRIDLAVDEYRPPLDVINPMTGQHQQAPASLAYWPRREWALISYDDVAMVFARRTAFPPQTINRLEVKGAVPDGPVIPSRRSREATEDGRGIR